MFVAKKSSSFNLLLSIILYLKKTCEKISIPETGKAKTKTCVLIFF